MMANKISPGAKRHVRRQKSRIRREYAHTDEIKEQITKLYERFGFSAKVDPERNSLRTTHTTTQKNSH